MLARRRALGLHCAAVGGQGLQVRTSNRQEVLLRQLAQQMARDPLPPLQNETVLVPGRAMGRWLRLGLARELGIAGSLDLPAVGTFLARLAGTGDDDLFELDALSLRVFRLLGDSARDRELAVPARYLADDPDQRKRWQLARRVAACLDAYQLHRDDLLRSWLAEAKAARSGPGKTLPHAAWQAHLWRVLAREAGVPAGPVPDAAGGLLPFAAPAAGSAAAADPHRLQRVRDLLADRARALAALPPRLALFGVGTLPPAVLDLLQRMAGLIPVTMYLLLPTEHYFGDVRRPRGDDAPDPAHDLLAALGRQSREFFDLLLDADATGAAIAPLEFADPGAATALAVLQSDLLHLRSRGPAGDAAPVQLRADDASLRIHGCHSPLREMEVLRDQILDAMEREPDLRPGDVLVLCPDIQAHAPFVQAVFGPLRDRLPFRIADRSPAAHQPMLAALLRILDLASARVTTPDVLHLLEEPALLRRFGLLPADLPAARDFLQRTRVRIWPDGPPAPDPAEVAPPHTLALARQRLLLGFCAGDLDALVGGVLPEADATEARAETLGRLLDLLAALQERWWVLGRPHRAAGWADQLERTLALLLQPETADERLAAEHVAGCARELRRLDQLAGLREELSPAVARDLLADMLARAGDAQGLFAGGVTFAALKPMRAVPARMLCIAGLGAEHFPRREPTLAFDLMAAQRRPGDRSIRDDDRHLFLEALLSARSRLHLSWVARSQKDDSPCAPSAVLSELLEHLDRSLRAPDGGPARSHLLLQHPLQAFSPRYRDGRDARLFTYAAPLPADAEPLRADAASFVAEPLPAAPAATGRRIALAELAQFWRNPARAFCQRTLDLRLTKPDERDDETEPFGLHRLDTYALQNDLVIRLQQGRDDPDAGTKAAQRGLLPALALGPIVHAELDLAARSFRGQLGASPRQCELQVQGPGWTVHGTVPLGETDEHRGPLYWRMATVKPKDRLVAWLGHLLWHAAAEQAGTHPAEDAGRTRVIGTRHSNWINRPSPGLALTWLGDLVAGMDAGQRAPLPFLERASYEWQKTLQSAAAGDPVAALQAARRAWLPQHRLDPGEARQPGDSEDVHVALCWRDQEVLGSPGFVEWAARIYGPLIGLLHEK